MVHFKIYSTENTSTMEFLTPNGHISILGVTDEEVLEIKKALDNYTKNFADRTGTVAVATEKEEDDEALPLPTLVWNPRSKRHERV